VGRRRAKGLAKIGMRYCSFEEAESRISAWIEEDYNRLYVHSALGYLSPEEFAQQWVQTQEATSAGAQI